MKVGGRFHGMLHLSRNVTHLLSDGKTPYERRFGQPFKGPIIPFCSLVEYYPITTKDQSRIHQFGKKVLPGLFLGYALYAGRIWKGDVLVADFEELETMDASEIYSKRHKEKGKLFSNRRWTNQTSWRWSGLENIHLGTAASNSRRKSPWFSWRIRRVSSTTSRLVSGCRWSNEWFLVHVRKLHIPPSRWTQSQTLLAERSIISFSTQIHWCIQSYSYEFGCQAGETHRWLLEYRWVKRFTLLEENLPNGKMCRGEINEKTTDIQATFYGQNSRRKWKNAKLMEKQKRSHEKLHLDNARKLRGIYFIDPEDKRFKETIKNSRKKLETPVAHAMPCKIIQSNKNCESDASNKIKSKLACILEAGESTKTAYGRIIADSSWSHLQEKKTIHYSIRIWFTKLFLCQAMKIPAAKAAVDKEWENSRTYWHGTWRKSETKKRWSMKQGKTGTSRR